MANEQNPQARYWLLTVPEGDWTPIGPQTQAFNDKLAYVRGQLEIGQQNGFRHWQLLVVGRKPIRRNAIKTLFGGRCHAEKSRSDAADDYVWKEETRVAGTQFELGEKPFKRNCSTDWAAVKDAAKSGRLDDVPADIYVRLYGSLKRIAKDSSVAAFRPNVVVNVFWGVTGSGKSHRAFDQAAAVIGPSDVYVKAPSTKWWDGYRGESCVIIDEFDGQIGITHLLRWLDKYPCRVEEKGGDLPLKATHWWICSNVNPDNWYPTAPASQMDALRRRFTNVVHFAVPYGQLGNQ